MDRKPLADFYAGGDPPQRQPSRMRLLRNAAHLYRLRLREQPLQELLALIGIAAGVALLFAVQVASTSITGAVEELSHGVAGRATVEIAARGPVGIDQQVAIRAARQPSVEAAAPILLQHVNVVGPRGSQSLTLFGVDDRLRRVGGSVIQRMSTRMKDVDNVGLYLASRAANAIGAAPGRPVTIQYGGKNYQVLLTGVMERKVVAGLADSPIAVAPLGQVQRITNSIGKITRVLIVPKPGAEQSAKRELRTLAAGQFDVRASDSEVRLLAQALKPDEQSSALFSAIAVAIGMLFAYNAMLLAAPRRRKMVAHLRMLGADRSTIIVALVFEAMMLGAAAAILGILLGDLLSLVAFRSVPEYLAAGFPTGTQRVIEPATIVLSFIGGLIAALLASTLPAIDAYRTPPGESQHNRVENPGGRAWLTTSPSFWLALALIAATATVVVIAPLLAPVGIAGLLISLALIVGPMIAFALLHLHRVTRVHGGVGLALAVDELTGNLTRAGAIAVIAAAAMAAAISIGGARQDLERGVDLLNRDFYSTSGLWITTDGSTNTFLTEQFDPVPVVRKLDGVRAVRSVRVNRGAFLDFDGRRLRVYGQSREGAQPLVRSQFLLGNPETATERIRAGGWMTLSNSLAKSLRAQVGEDVPIPTPSGTKSFRVAAITANYGWPPGTIVLNADEFSKYWRTRSATILGLDIVPGVSPDAARREVLRALGDHSSLQVFTPSGMVAEKARVAVQGLSRLRQISTLVLIASVLAIVAAMFAAVWQRRSALAALRSMGMYRSELYATLFSETALIVFLGGLIGLVFGIFAQALTTGYTETSSGYQAIFRPAVGLGVLALAKVMVLTSLATILPAYFASRVAPQSSSIE